MRRKTSLKDDWGCMKSLEHPNSEDTAATHRHTRLIFPMSNNDERLGNVLLRMRR